MDGERTQRLKVITAEMESIMKDVGPKCIRLAHLRKEASEIIAGLDKEKSEGR